MRALNFTFQDAVPGGGSSGNGVLAVNEITSPWLFKGLRWVGLFSDSAGTYVPVSCIFSSPDQTLPPASDNIAESAPPPVNWDPVTLAPPAITPGLGLFLFTPDVPQIMFDRVMNAGPFTFDFYSLLSFVSAGGGSVQVELTLFYELIVPPDLR